jgi:hypothetical protein
VKINPIYYLIVGVIILIALFLLLRPKTEQPVDTQSIPPQNQSSASPSATLASNIKSFELIIKQKQLQSGLETLQITQGDEVIIKITSDEMEEFHVHGYDKSIDLQKDLPAELKFTANLTGRFPFELEHSKIELGALEVQPK